MPKVIKAETVRRIRLGKREGRSLRELAEQYSVAKSTVSLHCRDLYRDDQRVYETESEARKAWITIRPTKPCARCGRPITHRARTELCRPCLDATDFFRPFLLRGNSSRSCVHHWAIDSPNGATSRGVCTKCGKTAEFPNSLEASTGLSLGSLGSWKGRQR